MGSKLVPGVQKESIQSEFIEFINELNKNDDIEYCVYSDVYDTVNDLLTRMYYIGFRDGERQEKNDQSRKHINFNRNCTADDFRQRKRNQYSFSVWINCLPCLSGRWKDFRRWKE